MLISWERFLSEYYWLRVLLWILYVALHRTVGSSWTLDSRKVQKYANNDDWGGVMRILIEIVVEHSVESALQENKRGQNK